SAELLLDIPPTTLTTYALSLHDALPIYRHNNRDQRLTALQTKFSLLHSAGPQNCKYSWSEVLNLLKFTRRRQDLPALNGLTNIRDRKSTRLNSSHVKISYAVFCLKKKNK